MNIWLILYLCMALTILYFMGWTLLILLRQKKAWRAFGETNDLRFDSESFSSSPTLEGTYKEYSINMFTGEYTSQDRRGVRKMTAIEVSLKSTIPFEGGIATNGLAPFLKEAGFTTHVPIDSPKWKKEYVVAAAAPYAMEKYLNDTRIDALLKLIKIKNAWVIAIFKDDVTLLRFDTPDALESEKKIAALLNRMVDVAQELELIAGEDSILKEQSQRAGPKDTAINIEAAEKEASELMLEEDDEDIAPKKKTKKKEAQEKKEPKNAKPTKSPQSETKNPDN